LTSKIEAIIFDYDGVLNDSLDVIRELYNEFHRLGITTKKFNTNKEISEFFHGDPHTNLERAGAKLSPELIKRCDKIVKKFIPKTDKHALFYDDADKLLIKLKDDGYRISIVSNGDKGAIKYKLKKYNVKPLVDVILGYEQMEKPKPHPHGILKCLKKMKLEPEQAIYVGDMESDISAAKAANVKVVAARYGYLTLIDNIDERLQGADKYAESPMEIYDKIKELENE